MELFFWTQDYLPRLTKYCNKRWKGYLPETIMTMRNGLQRMLSTRLPTLKGQQNHKTSSRLLRWRTEVHMSICAPGQMSYLLFCLETADFRNMYLVAFLFVDPFLVLTAGVTNKTYLTPLTTDQCWIVFVYCFIGHPIFQYIALLSAIRWIN